MFIGFFVDFVSGFVGATIWLSVPSFVTNILMNRFDFSFSEQMFIFIPLSILGLAITMFGLKKIHKRNDAQKEIKSAVDDLRNKKGVVIADNRGKINGSDVTWQIESDDNLMIGDEFIVRHRDGLTLFVSKIRKLNIHE